jgi:SAM-dependent methyltransferase
LDRNALAEHDRIEDTHWWFVARRQLLLDRLRRRIRPSKDIRVLEIGCGTGGNLAAFNSVYAASGVEPDAIAAARAREKSGAPVTVGALPAAAAMIPAGVAAVLCLDVLEHVADDGAALAALANHMPADALLVITVPAGPSLLGAHDRALGHYRRYTRAELIAKLRAAGLEIVFVSYFNSLLFPIAWLWRKFRGNRGTRTDMAPPPAAINWCLAKVFGLERWLLGLLPFPLGLSLLAEAKRGTAGSGGR